MIKTSMFDAESRKRLLQGAGIGTIATVTLGFGLGGWVLGGTAEKQSMEASRNAVVSVLAPICVDNFQRADAGTQALTTFQKEVMYKQTVLIEEGGWAVLPGNEKAGVGVASACAALLREIK